MFQNKMRTRKKQCVYFLSIFLSPYFPHARFFLNGFLSNDDILSARLSAHSQLKHLSCW